MKEMRYEMQSSIVNLLLLASLRKVLPKIIAEEINLLFQIIQFSIHRVNDK